MTFALELKTALEGNIDAEMAAGLGRVTFAAVRGLDDVAAGLQAKWRFDVGASGLANAGALEKTVRRKLYRNNGLNPAALVYSTMPAVELAFEQGAVIRVHGKLGALYPDPGVWGGRVRRPSGKSARASTLFAMGVRKFGNLQFIPTRGRGKQIGVFVAKLDRAHLANGVRRKAGVRALRNKAFETVVVFRVLREPRLPRLLRGDVIRARTARDFPGDYQRAFDRRLAEADRGPALLPATIA